MEEESQFTLDEWIDSAPINYTVPEETYNEIMVLLGEASAKCRALGLPFTFAIQTALRAEDAGAGIGGTSFIPQDASRVGPDALLNHLLFSRTAPNEALAMVSWAMQQREERKGPQILIPS